ncbi:MULTISPECIES: sugar phosphate isomerase/epimerase and 4-hydroxyphenylpyruvate domain-containing protein [unclassified Pseudonocardia]|uniref:sugar phosphate isomerase/epimerase and 4-hydroxyphenylpyruvate domain-containing protein n=1 Tax=unclassified Pseudonocardia TaxID=2619320 RepID=UPI000969CA11|nr:sugar phosphate isomerase/epimerase and 4-hydroxyphenylpyruvate domain-containing protein [Pseudonocardia sp. Ae707_Ps1]OLM18515.1 4-hydroxyphenylpyruvate dioxygenase [Pseudonocardia sp. Ae707_Ps1]
MSPEVPRLALATVCLSGTLEDKLAAAATAGFDGVEIFAPDLVADPLPPAAIGERCRDLGLSVDLYQPLRDIDSTDPDRFAANLRRAEATFDVMAGLGADTVLVCSSVAPDAVAGTDRLAAQLHTLAGRAQDRGIRIAYEALAWGRHVDTWDASWAAVAAADHPALGLCLDSFHVLARGSDPAPIAGVPGDKLFFLQLADARELSMDVLSWSRHHRLFPGQGGFDLPAFLAPVLAAGYSGPLSLEVFNDVFRQADPVRTAVDARRSLIALAEATARHGTGGTGGTGTDPVATPAPRLGGPAFVELAAGPELGRVLRALGFSRTGVHRTKQVERYRQGDATLLVNAAGPHPGTGSAVAAIALDSADPTASARRAARLCAPPLPRATGPGEADLAEISAPDGTSVFLCRTDSPTSWAHDFVTVDEPPVPGTGIHAIDHIGLTQPYDAFDEAVLFHRTVLGLGTVADGEYAAPFGLVRSRALADDARRVRIALTVSLLRRGEWGPGVADPQYVALACDDVLATAAAARAAGVPLLPVPGNYHDDLAARLDLPGPTIAAYRDIGVLHEHDSGGDYLQVCTELLGGRLFLALVQRTGTHDGHGWTDAPVRMAAHRRSRLARTAAPS